MTESESRLATDSSAIVEHAISIPRSARYYTLGPTHGFPRELWIVCHGYGQLARRFIQSFSALDDGTRLVVAPEALSRFYLDPIRVRRNESSPRVGATWMTREDRDAEIADYVSYLERVATLVRHALAGAAPRLVVFGFSQGTATVCRWLQTSDVRAERIILWSGGLPPEIDLVAWAARMHVASLTLVSGESDELVSPNTVTADAERLSAAGVAFDVVRHPGGHAIDSTVLVQLAARFSGH